MAEKLAKIYGLAVFDGVKAEGKVVDLHEQITELRQILNDNPELLRIMLHPDIRKEEKQQMVSRMFEKSLISQLYGLIQLLIEKDRVNHLNEIFDELEELYKEDQGIGVVYVTTAMPLKQEQIARLEKKLLSDTGYKTLEMIFDVDESLIAGMVIRIKDRRVDSSVAGRLKNMTRQLKTLQVK